MKWANILRRWSVRSLHSMILGAALVGPASFARAQSSNLITDKLPDRCFTRNHTFFLPVKMSEEQRGKIAAVLLYGKTSSSPWEILETGKPAMTQFNCSVAEDGEYWYSLVTVDRDNRPTPADVTLAPPMLRVVVDSAPPVLRVQASSVDGKFVLQCTQEDANPDLASLKAAYKTDKGEVSLEPVPNQPGLFRIPDAGRTRLPVVVRGKDLAQNEAVKEVNLGELIGAKLKNASASDKAPGEIALASGRPDSENLPPLPPRVEAPPKLQTPPKEFPVKSERPVTGGLSERIEMPAPPSIGPLTKANPGNPAPAEESVAKAPNSAAEAPARNSIPVQLINTTHASVEYRIDQVGPSGVGKVEIYWTPDKGQSWHRFGEDPDKRSPADINLPGEGVFGIRMVISNGNGFGGRAPLRGDAPHCEIEVDATPPFVQIRSAEVLPGTGQVEIRWLATDKNLGAAPVNLFFRTKAEGPWQVAARELKNDGVHRWNFPRETGSNLFFKIEVTDRAGNAAHDVTRQPIVIDMSEPRATVVGVTGGGTNRPMP